MMRLVRLLIYLFSPRRNVVIGRQCLACTDRVSSVRAGLRATVGSSVITPDETVNWRTSDRRIHGSLQQRPRRLCEGGHIIYMSACGAAAAAAAAALTDGEDSP